MWGKLPLYITYYIAYSSVSSLFWWAVKVTNDFLSLQGMHITAYIRKWANMTNSHSYERWSFSTISLHRKFLTSCGFKPLYLVTTQRNSVIPIVWEVFKIVCLWFHDICWISFSLSLQNWVIIHSLSVHCTFCPFQSLPRIKLDVLLECTFWAAQPIDSVVDKERKRSIHSVQGRSRDFLLCLALLQRRWA